MTCAGAENQGEFNAINRSARRKPSLPEGLRKDAFEGKDEEALPGEVPMNEARPAGGAIDQTIGAISPSLHAPATERRQPKGSISSAALYLASILLRGWTIPSIKAG